MRTRTATLVLSVDPETKERLKVYAQQNRKSISQAVTDWAWTLPIKKEDNNNGKENGGGDA